MLTTGAHRLFLAQTASCITEPMCQKAQLFPSSGMQKQSWLPRDICTDKLPSPKISSLRSPGQSPEIAQCCTQSLPALRALLLLLPSVFLLLPAAFPTATPHLLHRTHTNWFP